MKKIAGLISIILGGALALGVAIVIGKQDFHFSQDMSFNVGSIIGYVVGLSIWAMAILHLFRWGLKRLKNNTGA